MIFGAFSIRSLNVLQVRLLSLTLREPRISRRLGPLATTRGGEIGFAR